MLVAFAALLASAVSTYAEQSVLFSSPSSASVPASSFEIVSLSRNIDLGGASTKESSIYTLTRNSNKNEGSLFVFALNDNENDEEMPGNLAWLEASVGKTSASRKALAVRALRHDPEQHVRFYAVDVPPTASASANEQTTITINTMHNHASIPKPAYVSQDSRLQGLEWIGDLLGGAGASGHTFNAGTVKVRVKSNTPRVNAETVLEGWSASHPAGSATITFTNTASISSGRAIAAVQYDHPEPVISVLSLQRTAQVSHWGNHLSIQDDYHLYNSGPKLKGHFSRLAHQAISYMKRTGQGSGAYPHVLTSLSMALPPNVHSPYFIDDVGNVSTSRFRPSPKVDATRRNSAMSYLELTPRYPLMGGWNYTYSIGYKQPLEDVLRAEKGTSRYTLAVPFVTPMKGIATDEVELRIILPEGASDITVSPPFPVSSSTQSISYSYLDTSGRPTLSLTKRDITERHALDVLVSYKYSTVNTLQKPLVVGGIMFGLFVLAGIVKRIRWSFI